MGNFDMLSSDIMLDILSLLPAESVSECKLVSKPWRNLLQHPSFSQFHLNHLLHSDRVTCIFHCVEPETDKFYYSEYDDNCHEAPFNRRVRMNLSPPYLDCCFAGSCNGLILFNAWVPDETGKRHYGPAYICNPITREYVILPKFEEYYWWTGFGYIPSTNEYKLVRICESDLNVGTVEVYTLGSGIGWRNAGTMDIIDVNDVRQHAGQFASGALHWENNKGTIILAFHLADEKFSQVPPPPCLTGAGIELGVLGDNLSAAYYHNAGGCEIWLRKKNEDTNALSWIKEFVIDIHVSLPFELTKSGRLLCFDDASICSHDPKASFAKIDVGFGKYISEVSCHKNTFVSLKVLGEEDTETM